MASSTRSAKRRLCEEERLERLLRVGTCLAQCGYGTQAGQLAACAPAFRGDAQLWTALVRHRGPRGRTVLMHAAIVGSVSRLTFLLELGADVDAGNIFGNTALMCACGAGHCDAARLLVERGGANVNAARTADGASALMVASEKGDVDIVRFLVERGGANVNAARTTDGSTALMTASENGHLETLLFLVEHGGANVNAARTTDGMTAFMWACPSGHHEIVRLLLKRGALVNAARALCGRTPLMFASLNDHVTTVRLLLEHGALKHVTDLAGRTARDHASSHPLVLAMLA